MDELFRWQPVADPSHLSQHMQTAIMHYVELAPAERDSLERPVLSLASAILSALRTSTNPAGVFHAFHFAVFVQAQLLRPERDDFWGDDDQKTASAAVTATIKACVSRKSPDDGGWTSVKFPEFFDYAAARRRLWSAAQDIKCQEVHYHYKPCFHKTNLPLLQMLQKAAHGEIRSRIMIAVGRQLPVELADAVYECALLTEDIPLDWNVECPEDGAREPFFHPLDYMIKEEYRCGRIQRGYTMKESY